MKGKTENMNRREFLKVGAGVSTFAAFPGLAKAVAVRRLETCIP